MEGRNVFGREFVKGEDSRLTPDVRGQEKPRGWLVLSFDDCPADVVAGFAAPVEAVNRFFAEADDAVQRLGAFLLGVGALEQVTGHFFLLAAATEQDTAGAGEGERRGGANGALG